ncbi:MAG: tRNA (guanosine(37)-N1)-methyltransferase TrmD [Lachnospiraceae bacterium]|nr:tRNA (guanosine(37)-N1)-methyltransferase TrmD [Lachnospiraceae bacterium]
MNFYVLTLFPEMIMNGLSESITGRAMNNNLINVEAINIRDFAENKYGHIDDYPYGGGAGMVIQPGPVYSSYQKVVDKIGKKPRVIYMTPQGKVFNQTIAEEFSKEEDLVFLCGHYEGIDERVLEMIVTDNVSIGDYVLTGGELPSMVMIDSISRLVPGVLNNETSAEFESFNDNLLEYPQYTRPAVFMDKEVPPILLSGNHAKVDQWRREKSIERTLERRPDLLENANLSKKDIKYLNSLKEKDNAANK